MGTLQKSSTNLNVILINKSEKVVTRKSNKNLIPRQKQMTISFVNCNLSRLYYGGGQKRPDAMYCKSIKNFSGKEISLVGQSNRKDIRNAVEAAQKAQPGWAKRSGLSKFISLFNLKVLKLCQNCQNFSFIAFLF